MILLYLLCSWHRLLYSSPSEHRWEAACLIDFSEYLRMNDDLNPGPGVGGGSSFPSLIAKSYKRNTLNVRQCD